MRPKAVRKRKMFSNRRAVSPAISNVIMAGAIIVTGFLVLTWTYSKSSDFNLQYSSSMQMDLNKIREKLVFECVFYDSSRNELNVYILNCGGSPNMSLGVVTLSNSSWRQSFSNVSLRLLNGTLIQGLSLKDEGVFKLSANLQAGSSYSLSVSTNRGRFFVAKFIA